MLPAILIPLAIQLGTVLINEAVKKYHSLPVEQKQQIARNKKVRGVIQKRQD